MALWWVRTEHVPQGYALAVPSRLSQPASIFWQQEKYTYMYFSTSINHFNSKTG